MIFLFTELSVSPDFCLSCCYFQISWCLESFARVELNVYLQFLGNTFIHMLWDDMHKSKHAGMIVFAFSTPNVDCEVIAALMSNHVCFRHVRQSNLSLSKDWTEPFGSKIFLNFFTDDSEDIHLKHDVDFWNSLCYNLIKCHIKYMPDVLF